MVLTLKTCLVVNLLEVAQNMGKLPKIEEISGGKVLLQVVYLKVFFTWIALNVITWEVPCEPSNVTAMYFVSLTCLLLDRLM